MFSFDGSVSSHLAILSQHPTLARGLSLARAVNHSALKTNQSSPPIPVLSSLSLQVNPAKPNREYTHFDFRSHNASTFIFTSRPAFPSLFGL